MLKFVASHQTSKYMLMKYMTMSQIFLSIIWLHYDLKNGQNVKKNKTVFISTAAIISLEKKSWQSNLKVNEIFK